MSSYEEEYIESPAAPRLFVRSWRPAGTPRAAIAICPGFNSHGGYYGGVAERFVALGFAVLAVDLRGRGRSDGERYYVDTISEYVDDVGRLVALATSRAPAAPVFLLGHSAGGVVSCVYALDHQAELAGLICESFAFRVYAPDFALAVLGGISHLAPHAHVLRLPNKHFSRDPAVVAAMDADPFVAHEVQPTRTVAQMVKADQRLERESARLELPVLILHGTRDLVTKPEGSQRFFESVGSRDKTLKLYDGHYHDLLNDDGKELVLGDIERWLEARLAPA